jgi:hypothetical protein
MEQLLDVLSVKLLDVLLVPLLDTLSVQMLDALWVQKWGNSDKRTSMEYHYQVQGSLLQQTKS